MELTETIADPGSIARLREMKPMRAAPCSLNEIRAWVTTLATHPWCGPDALAECQGIPVEQFLDDVVDLSMFLSHTTDVEVPKTVWTEDWADERGGQQTLFPSDAAEDDCIVVSKKFSAKQCGINLQHSVARIVATEIDNDLLSRWAFRRYNHLRPLLDYSIVSVVWRFAQLGRIEDIDQVVYVRGCANYELSRLVVEAWDLLCFAIGDAQRGVEGLLASVNVKGEDLQDDEIIGALSRVRFLHDGVARRLHRARELAVLGNSKAWRDEILTLESLVTRGDTPWLPQTVADLTDGQVLRLAQAAGLSTDPPGYEVEQTVREWIVEAGLEADLTSHLFDESISYLVAGHGDQLRQALDLRAEGNFAWADQLHIAAGV